jgi:hypothetical protein
MGALAVHNLSARIHGLTNQVSDAKKDADPALGELRQTLIGAYAELATASQQLVEKHKAKAAAAVATVTAR